MSAAKLRQAAAEIRAKAEAATPGPWEFRPRRGFESMRDNPATIGFADTAGYFVMLREGTWATEGDMAYIAAMHPAVALAVADWLDGVAAHHSPSDTPMPLCLHYDSDEECETCEDGGHPVTVCEGCFPTWEGMDGYSIYPCRETKAALAVADTILGGAS